MKILRNLFLFLVLILLIGFIVSLFMPKTVEFERSIVMDAPQEMVFGHVNELKEWSKWSPWFAADPEMKLVYSDPSSGKGSFYEWDGDVMGKGKMDVTESDEYALIKTALDFGPMGSALADFNFQPLDDKTKVTWKFFSDLGYNPMSRFFGSSIKKEVSKNYEQGLLNLKNLTEKLAKDKRIKEAEEQLKMLEMQENMEEGVMMNE